MTKIVSLLRILRLCGDGRNQVEGDRDLLIGAHWPGSTGKLAPNEVFESIERIGGYGRQSGGTVVLQNFFQAVAECDTLGVGAQSIEARLLDELVGRFDISSVLDSKRTDVIRSGDFLQHLRVLTAVSCFGGVEDETGNEETLPQPEVALRL